MSNDEPLGSPVEDPGPGLQGGPSLTLSLDRGADQSEMEAEILGGLAGRASIAIPEAEARAALWVAAPGQEEATVTIWANYFAAGHRLLWRRLPEGKIRFARPPGREEDRA